MANTTNYNWETPDDSDLVKDGALAIRTLGSSIDTTTKALNPSTTLGDIEYRSSTANTNTRLAIGSTGDVLTVAGGVPSWAAPAPGGGMTLIQEQVASSSSSLSFTGIAGTYKQLFLTWHGINHSAIGSLFAIRLNNDSGSKYAINMTSFQSATANTVGDLRTSISGTNWAPFGLNATGGQLRLDAMGYLMIDNYASTTKLKFFQGSWNYFENNGGEFRNSNVVTGTFNDTSAITSLDVVRISGTDTFSNRTNTSIRLYGIA